MTNNTEELAALKARVAELERATTPPDPAAQERASAAFRQEIHELREGRLAHAMPPSAVRDMAVLGDEMVKGIVRDNRAPSGPSMSGIPSSQTISGVRPGGGPANVPGNGTGWQNPVPLSPPPGIHMVDALCIADDVRQRSKEPKL